MRSFHRRLILVPSTTTLILVLINVRSKKKPSRISANRRVVRPAVVSHVQIRWLMFSSMPLHTFLGLVIIILCILWPHTISLHILITLQIWRPTEEMKLSFLVMDKFNPFGTLDLVKLYQKSQIKSSF